MQEILARNRLSTENLQAVAVSKGPGSYTGLRIGVSAAKGLAFALQIPLISVDTLGNLARQVTKMDVLIIPMIDARRMEVYAGIYDSDYNTVRQVQADVLDENSYAEYLNQKKTVFLGDAVAKVQDIIKHPNAVFYKDKLPSAREMSVLSYEKFRQQDFEDTAYFEPFYLKDFITTRKK